MVAAGYQTARGAPPPTRARLLQRRRRASAYIHTRTSQKFEKTRKTFVNRTRRASWNISQGTRRLLLLRTQSHVEEIDTDSEFHEFPSSLGQCALKPFCTKAHWLSFRKLFISFMFLPLFTWHSKYLSLFWKCLFSPLVQYGILVRFGHNSHSLPHTFTTWEGQQFS